MQKFLRELRNLNNWIAVIPVIFFFVVVAFGLLSQNSIAIITNGLDIGGAVLLNFALLPVWLRILHRRGTSPEAFLFGGILMIVNGVAGSRLWSLAVIMSGKPSWMVSHWLQSFCYLMVGLGMFYLLKVPGNGHTAGMRYIAWGLVLSVGVMTLFLLYKEN